MLAPAFPADEAQRLQALQALHLLDTEAEERFDRFTRLAKRLFGVAVVSVTLVDAHRQWAKSIQGIELRELPRRVSFCGHAILSDALLLVPDARLDERFADNPLVTGEPFIRFYAGQPLRAPNGQRIGTLCLIDRDARAFGDEDQALLKDLALMVEHEIALLQLATVDELTGLSNRRGFEALARHALSLCGRQQRPATLLFFDLNRFKAINDQFGHAAGDQALVAFAGLLRKTFRESDVVARLGGDEFAVLLSNAPQTELAGALQRLRDAVQGFNSAQPAGGWQLLYSVGSAAFDPARHANAQELLNEADRLMYEDKLSAGRER
ncbi:sensor domain-containing diguanylate cyclase [Paucibacter sp. APW11]|uniref:Sensor domain-containing diguanylate cyclase n=1 Tax=Roseateles aquae TaxID=3077235 RepID=A0ABU3PG93_9BURK|nr:sensor domain-containing diguanylate cyclase [Paucibacter sp. APW11]MDT9000976.1 sensor domain-containing diguanylate cyclase [Paucibacter sp. APW11]